MRVLVVGECAASNVFRLEDPSIPNEDEFTSVVIRALQCVYPNYACIGFRGTFCHDGNRFRPDLALIANDFSHWFVIEVELASHSLQGHVLPQLRAFRYGTPDGDCVNSLANGLSITLEQAKTLIAFVPRSTVVIANERRDEWERALLGLDAQLIVVSAYSGEARSAFEIDGQMQVVKENLGFGSYSATDRALRFAATHLLPVGEFQMDDPGGFGATWISRRSGEMIWMSRIKGGSDLPDQCMVQVLRTHGNRLALRVLSGP